jgi:hypothetical protein
MTQFVHGCIAARCDYLNNVRGVGIHKAFSFVQSGNLFEELRKKGSVDNYPYLFQMALAVFHHQPVFNPTTRTVQPLKPWTEEPGEQVNFFCGLYPNIACNIFLFYHRSEYTVVCVFMILFDKFLPHN